MRKKVRVCVSFCMVLVMLLLNAVVPIEPVQSVRAEGYYPIMGKSNVNTGKLINYYLSKATYPSYYQGTDAPTIDAFCQIYMEECAAENVRVEVAFCQAMKETGFLTYKGRVPITANNFAGLGAIDSNASAYATFASVRQGVRAQIQHLKAYATTEPLVNTCVDPKFHLVTRGSAVYVEWLGQKENPSGKGWATAVNYGYSIRDDYMAKLTEISPFSTWYKGTDYQAVYDPIYYMEAYADMQANYSTNGDGLIAHFVNYGMKEGRQAKADFNVVSYKNAYPDLRNCFGNNLSDYYYHYIKTGQQEGRVAVGYENKLIGGISVLDGVDYSAIYNYDEYITRNPDVKNYYGADDIAVLNHFVNSGMAEGRQAISSFDVNSYRNRYADLRRAYGNDLKKYYMHYLNYGKKEGRTASYCTTLQNPLTVYNGVDYSAVYDYNYYLSHNSDIKMAFRGDEEKTLEHFVNSGMNEGRQGSENFNVSSYRNRYGDLRRTYGNDTKAYYEHYMRFGNNEKRVGVGYENTLKEATTVYAGKDYKDVYDFEYYIKCNPDVLSAFGYDENKVLSHFVNCGMSEGRQAKADFSVQAYKAAYEDLQVAFGNDLKLYYLHFMNHGKSEGRVAI